MHHALISKPVDGVDVLARLEIGEVIPPLEQKLVADEAEPRGNQQPLLLSMGKHILELRRRHVSVFDWVTFLQICQNGRPLYVLGERVNGRAQESREP